MITNIIQQQKHFEIFQFIQYNFSFEICKQLFPSDPEHFWSKWVNYDSNLIAFLSCFIYVYKHI